MIGTSVQHYKILEKLGGGGMGVVYRAMDTRLGRPVAIKFLPDGLASDPERLQRFRREACAASALNHPHICTVHDVGEEDGRPFLVMELMLGEVLADLIGGRAMDNRRIVELGAQVAEALEAAHAAGIVHRDVKPANIFVTERGDAKVLDFGLAKVMPREAPGPSEAETEPAPIPLTTPGATMGTIAYMSPEQVRGEPVDERTDLFSLGVVLYEMATGRRPFEGRTEGVVWEAILNAAPAAPSTHNPDLLEGLEPILGKALEKDRALRYQSARDLRIDLERLRRDTEPTRALVGEGPDRRLAAALEALEEHRWQQAFALLSAVDAARRLGAEDLERLGEAAFWAGRHDECLQARERAFGAWVEAGDKERAAYVATQIADAYAHRRAKAVSEAWTRRAAQLVEDRPQSAAYGYVLRFGARVAIEVERDYERALETARRVVEIARQTGDRGLWALGTQDQGRILVLLGRLSEGLALLDEAMAAAVSGELPVEVSGKTFCNMIGTCETLADYRRAGEWCQVAREWSQPHAASWYPGICRVHHAELLRLRGDWLEAERHARQTEQELARVLPEVAAEARYLIGEIELRRGELAGAEASFQRAHELGRDPLPGLALLRLAQGRLPAAVSLLDRALGDEGLKPLQRARLLPARLEIAIAAGDLETARSIAGELGAVAAAWGTTALLAHAAAARGALLLAGGEPESALRELREACKLWREIDLVYEAARSRELLAEAYLGSACPEDAALELRAAEKALESLGAVRDLERVRERLTRAAG